MSKKALKKEKVSVDSSKRRFLKNTGKAAAIAPAAALLLAAGPTQVQAGYPDDPQGPIL